MEKIGPAGTGFYPRRDRSKKKVRNGEKPLSNFPVVLREIDETVRAVPSSEATSLPIGDGRSLESFLDDLHGLGERLKQTPTMSAVLEYKRAVKNFLGYVVTHALETEEREGVKFTNPLKEQKRYTLIRVVDRKVEQLAAGVIQNQRQQLDMLKAVDEIYGLLVDLLR